MALHDTELIQRTLEGDESAFGFLVDKYKGSVHALAYRKLGNFHIAEEITQDTFLKAYQKLSTLKDPGRFPRLALCDCRTMLYLLAPAKSPPN